MANAAALLAKVNRALIRVAPLNKIVYTRVVTSTGDKLIGRVTATSVDTIMSPQPIALQTGRERQSGPRDQVATTNSPSGIRLTDDDYIMTVSSSSITTAELQNKSLYFVLKNPDGTQEESMFIMDWSTVKYQGLEIIYEVFIRSVKTL